MSGALTVGFDQASVLALLLAFGRIGGLLQSLPLLSLKSVPIPVRVGFGFLLAALISPQLAADPALATASAPRLGLMFASEALLGLAMGFSVAALLAVIDIAGSFIGMNAGMAVAVQFDPMSGGQSVVLTRLLQIGAFLTFLLLDLHHDALLAVCDSFRLAPPGHGVLAFTAGRDLALRFGAVFVDALRISMPVLAVAFFVNLVAALVTRFAQSMNIYFSVGLAAQAPIGLAATAFAIPAVIGVVVALGAELPRMLLGMVG